VVDVDRPSADCHSNSIHMILCSVYVELQSGCMKSK